MRLLVPKRLPQLLVPKDAVPGETRVLRTSLSPGGPSPHRHDARLDKDGNGLTSMAAGHFHPVVNYKVTSVLGHTHKLIKFKHTRSIGLRGTAYKTGKDWETPKPEAQPGQPGETPKSPDLLPPDANASGAPTDLAWRVFDAPLVVEGQESTPVQGLLGKLVQEGDSILDIGCWDGGLYDGLMKWGRAVRYFGIEPNEDMLAAFQRRFPEAMGKTALAGFHQVERTPLEHYTIAIALNAEERLDDPRLLSQLVSALDPVADIIVLGARSPRAESRGHGLSMTEAKRLFQDRVSYEIRPFTSPKDYAVVAYRRELVR